MYGDPREGRSDVAIPPKWAPETAGVKQPILSDKGSRRTYAERFWGQVLSKYLLGTQGRPNLCFGGFSTCGEPNLT